MTDWCEAIDLTKCQVNKEGTEPTLAQLRLFPNKRLNTIYSYCFYIFYGIRESPSSILTLITNFQCIIRVSREGYLILILWASPSSYRRWVATFQGSLNGRPLLHYRYTEPGSYRRHPFTSLMQINIYTDNLKCSR